MKLSEFKKQIREHIVDILSEGPMEDTAAKDAEKKAIEAKMKALLAQKASLSKPQADPPLEEDALDEMGRQVGSAGTVSIVDREALEVLKASKKYAGKKGERIINVIIKADSENKNLTKKQIAIAAGYKDQPDVNPIINLFKDYGVLRIEGAAPSEPKEKEPKVKMVKPKALAIPKDETPEDVKDTYYDADAEDIGFDDEKEPTKADISKNVGSKFSSTGDKYKALLKQMKDIADKYKAASGDEAKAYVDQLKDLTKEKKKLEAILNPSISDEEEEF